MEPTWELKVEDVDIDGSELCYPSGLLVTVVRDSRDGSLSVTTVYDGGFAASRDREQLPHLVEHAWFRSSPDGRSTAREALFAAGADTNGWTTLDATTYVTTGPAGALDDILAMEAARMRDPLMGVTADALAIEREVVRNELRGGPGAGEYDAFAVLRSGLFPVADPYHSVGSATTDSLDRIDLDALAGWAREHYRPDSATPAITGPISTPALKAALEKAYGEDLLYRDRDGKFAHNDCAPPPRAALDTPMAPIHTDLGEVVADVDRPLLLLGWALPPAWTADELDARLAVALLQSHLYQDLVIFGDRVRTIDCSYSPGARASLAVCALDLTNRADTDAVAIAAKNAVGRAWSKDPDETTWGRSRQAAFGTILHSFEVRPSPGSPDSTHPVLYSHFSGSMDWQSDTIAQLDRFDEHAATKLGATWLAADRMVAERFVPATESFATSSPPLPVASRSARVSSQLPALHGSVSAASLSTGPDLAQRVEITLPNGMRAVILPYGDAPVVHMALVFRGGWANEGAPALDDVTWSSTGYLPLTSGVPLDEALLRIAGRWGSQQGASARTIELDAASGNLDQGLFLLDWFAQSLGVDTRLQLQARDAYGAWSGSAERKPEWLAYEARNQHVAAGTPLAVPIASFVRSARAFEVPQLEKWHRATIRPDTTTLYVVGRVDPEEARMLITGRFEGWQRPKKPAAPLPTPAPAEPAPERQVVLIDADRPTVDVELSCQLRDADSAAIRLTADVVDQLAWTRLREASGLTYTPHVYGDRLPGPIDTLTVQVEVAPDRAGDAVDALFGLIHTVHAEPPPELFGAVQVHAIASFATENPTGTAVLLALRDADLDGEPLETRAERIVAVEIGDVARELDPCESHEIVTIIGPRATISPQLDALGIAWR